MKGFINVWLILGQKDKICWILNDEKTGMHYSSTNRAEVKARLIETVEKYPENTYTIQGVMPEIDSDELV